jgi:predicted transcriptional regulator of viral defense system
MSHLGEPYYVALLSAAAYHGAAPQQPKAFQVMVAKARRGLECGAVRVDWVARRDLGDTPVVERNTPGGVVRIASPAATALELVGYSERCGSLENVAMVLVELAESIDGDALEAQARRAPTAWVQRLGYLLDLFEQDELADRLERVLATRRLFAVPLDPSDDMDDAARDARWRVALNTDLEPED